MNILKKLLLALGLGAGLGMLAAAPALAASDDLAAIQKAGVIRIGEQLSMTLALPGQARQEIKPRVLEWVPNEQLHWRLSLLGGAIKTLRYIEIEALSETGCVVLIQRAKPVEFVGSD